MKDDLWQDYTVQALKQAYAERITQLETDKRELLDALESLKYYINNPSAWGSYDESVSEVMRAAVIPMLAKHQKEAE